MVPSPEYQAFEDEPGVEPEPEVMKEDDKSWVEDKSWVVPGKRKPEEEDLGYQEQLKCLGFAALINFSMFVPC